MSGVSFIKRPGGMRIAVLYNVDFESAPTGDAEDTEPPIFWKANTEVAEVAASVAESLHLTGHTPLVMAVHDSIDDLVERLRASRVDLVFNLVESLGADTHREPEVPRCLSAAGIPFTGCGPEILTIAHAKDAARALLRAARVPVPNGVTVLDSAQLEEIDADEFEFPLFVKPARADGSIGIDQGSIVHSAAELAERVRHLERLMPGPFIVEDYLPGREFNVAIFPEPVGGQLVATEVDFSGIPANFNPIVTYDCKWEPESPEYVAFSAPAVDRVPPLLYQQLLDVAGRAFVALRGDGYGRVDLRLDRNGTPRVIDVNPNPDIHPDAGLSIAARSEGIDYRSLVSQIVASALRRGTYARSSRMLQRP